MAVHIVKTYPHTEDGPTYHLVADNHRELRRAARHAGLNPEQMRRSGTEFEHYDVFGSDIRKVMRKHKEIGRKKYGVFLEQKRKKI